MLALDCITGLQTARILASNGIPVIGVADDTKHFACRSRRVGRVHQGDATRLADLLRRLQDSIVGRFVVIPCSDQYVAALLRCESEWPENMSIVLPEQAVAETLMDKARFARFATANQIPIPPTAVISDLDDTDQLSAFSYPVVIKPARKPPDWDSWMGGKVTVASTLDEALTVIERGLRKCDELVVQEWVAGGDDALLSFNGYFDRTSLPLATFIARKLRQWPPKAGTSASGEEVRDDQMLGLATDLFARVGYRGLAYLEVKRDPTNDTLVVIEPNIGRPTGRSAISEAGGVSLIHTAYRDALGLPPIRNNEQTYAGVKWLYLRHDLQAAVSEIRAGQLSVGGWLGSIRGRKVFAVWSLTDPAPFFVDIFQALRKALGHRGQP